MVFSYQRTGVLYLILTIAPPNEKPSVRVTSKMKPGFWYDTYIRFPSGENAKPEVSPNTELPGAGSVSKIVKYFMLASRP